MLVPLHVGDSKAELVEKVRAHLHAQGFEIAEIDAARPWGAFLRVVNEQADKFIATYFGDVAIPENARHGERSPKILLVAPEQRLSWQYHDRRAELWRTVANRVGVYVSATNEPPNEIKILELGETIALAQGTRHRLVGLDTWGAIAEIWIHVDAQNPSNENDIYRLQDDYSRTSPV